MGSLLGRVDELSPISSVRWYQALLMSGPEAVVSPGPQARGDIVDEIVAVVVGLPQRSPFAPGISGSADRS